MQINIDYEKDFDAEDELWAAFYTCPNCASNNVVINSNYCSKCGVKLIRQGTPKK